MVHDPCLIFFRFFFDCFLRPLASAACDRTLTYFYLWCECVVAPWLRPVLQVQANFGDMGSGSLATSLNVKYLNTLTNLCIVRAARDNYQLALASASLVRTGTSAEMRIRDAVSIITTDQARVAIYVFLILRAFSL